MQAIDDREQLERTLSSSMTPADLAEQLERVISNDHALHDERRRLVILAAAGELERARTAHAPLDEPYPRVAVADALRDWIRDDMPGFIVDAAEPRLRMDWRTRRAQQISAGVNVRDSVGWRSWEDSVPNGLAMLAREVLGFALAHVDWTALAGELLAEDENGVPLEQLARTLAGIRELESSPDTDPTGTGTAAPLVAERLGLETLELAEHVHYLSGLGLAGSRFVGGTSGTLVHSIPAELERL